MKRDMRFKRNVIATIIFAVIAMGLVVYAIRMVADFPHWLVDDAFILFRYAENLVETGELTWNPGENPTEGYTGLTLILLIASAMKFGVSPIIATHVIGIGSFFGCAALIILTLRGFNLGSIAALALFLVASLLLVSLTRPEGAILSLILLAAYRPFTLRMFLCYIIPSAIYFIWRFAYYGQLLPNTYYAKSASVGVQMENLVMIRQFATTFLLIPTLLVVIYGQWETIKKYKFLIIGVSAFSLVVLYTYISSELTMKFSYRFLVPFYSIARTPLSFRSAAIALIIIAPWIVKNANGKHLKEYKEYCSKYYKMLQDEHIAVGRFINTILPPDECIIVHSDAGAIPYQSKRKTIDFGGLNDEFLAHSKSSISENVDYFYSHNAGALVFTSHKSDRLEHGKEAKSIERDPRFENYSLVKKYMSGARRQYFEFLYVRNDLLDSIPAEEVAKTSRSIKNTGKSVSRRRPDDSRTAIGSLSDTATVTVVPGVEMLQPDTQTPEEIWARAQTKVDPASRIHLYRNIINRHPDHDLAPKALFMIGFIYSEELNEEKRAVNTFEELIKRYPVHPFAETAKWMIENMDKPSPETEQLEHIEGMPESGGENDSL
jgi:arabinofuranosyltransferase